MYEPFIFSSEPSPFQWTKLSKTEGAWNKRPVRLQNKFSKILLSLLVTYMLSNHVWWFIINWFLSYSKNYICNFMQANSWHHKLFQFPLYTLLNLESVERKGIHWVNLLKMKKSWQKYFFSDKATLTNMLG